VVGLTQVETRAAARTHANVELRRSVRRAECSNFVDLARRMSLAPDEAVRQFIDRSQRRFAEPRQRV